MMSESQLKVRSERRCQFTSLQHAWQHLWPLGRSKEGSLAFEKVLRARQSRSIYQPLGLCDGLRIERCNPPGKIVDKSIQLTVRETPINPAIALGGLGIEIVAADDNFECAGSSHKLRQSFVRTTAGQDTPGHFGWEDLQDAVGASLT
jgi:hypothetical protein